MKISLSKSDVIWSYIGTITSMGANIILLPFLMRYLDSDSLGLWYIFASLGNLATLFDMGFAVTFSRNITYCWSGARKLKKEDVIFPTNNDIDYALLQRILAASRMVYASISLITFALLITLGTYYIRFISIDIEGNKPIFAWGIYALAIFLNLYYGYYASYLRGVGAINQANKNIVISRSLQICLTVILTICGFGLVGACISYMIYGVTFRVLGKHYFYKVNSLGDILKKLDVTYSKGELLDLIKVVWHNAWRDGIISISSYLLNQASTIICSFYLSLADTAAYSIGVQIASAISVISGTLYNAYQPELQSAYILNDKEKMRKTMSLVVMSFIYFFVLGCTMFSIVGIPVLRMIKPDVIVSINILICLYLYQFILKYRNCYTSYFSSTNRVIYVKAFVFSALLCIVLSFVLTGYYNMGVWGLIIAQIASQIIYNVWYWPLRAHRELQISLVEMIGIGTNEVKNSVFSLFNINTQGE